MNVNTPLWLRFIDGTGSEQGSSGEREGTGAASTGEGESMEESSGDNGSVDWKAKYEAMRQHSRTWEQRAKANQDAAQKLAEREEAEKSELEKARDAQAKAVSERDAALLQVTRFSIAAEFGLSAEDAELFLTGDDEETMRKQARALSERTQQKKVENPNQGAAGATGSKALAEEWAKKLLKK